LFYLNCSRCWLSVRVLSDYMTMEHCPRCRARAGLSVELFRSPLPARFLMARQQASPDDRGRRPTGHAPPR
jgi:hypothetical protein